MVRITAANILTGLSFGILPSASSFARACLLFSIRLYCLAFTYNGSSSRNSVPGRGILWNCGTPPVPGTICWQNNALLSVPSCSRHYHLLQLGVTNSSTCERCLEKAESATHIPCEWKAIPHLRFPHLGHYFMELSDYHDDQIRKVLSFIIRVRLTEE